MKKRLLWLAPAFASLALGCVANMPSQTPTQNAPVKMTTQSTRVAPWVKKIPPLPMDLCDACIVDGGGPVRNTRFSVFVSDQDQTVTIKSGYGLDKTFYVFDISDVQCDDNGHAWITAVLPGTNKTILVYVADGGAGRDVIAISSYDFKALNFYSILLKDYKHYNDIYVKCDNEPPPPPPPGECVCWVTGGGQVNDNDTTYAIGISRTRITINDLNQTGRPIQATIDSTTCDGTEATITATVVSPANDAGTQVTVVVHDNGEGNNAPPDTFEADFAANDLPDIGPSTLQRGQGQGNIQIHQECTPGDS